MRARISTGRKEIGDGDGDKGVPADIDTGLGGVELDGSATMAWDGIGCETTCCVCDGWGDESSFARRVGQKYRRRDGDQAELKGGILRPTTRSRSIGCLGMCGDSHGCPIKNGKSGLRLQESCGSS